MTRATVFLCLLAGVAPTAVAGWRHRCGAMMVRLLVTAGCEGGAGLGVREGARRGDYEVVRQQP